MCNQRSNLESSTEAKTETQTAAKFIYDVNPVQASLVKSYTPAQMSAASFWHGNSPVISDMPSAEVAEEITLPPATNAPRATFGIGKDMCK